MASQAEASCCLQATLHSPAATSASTSSRGRAERQACSCGRFLEGFFWGGGRGLVVLRVSGCFRGFGNFLWFWVIMGIFGGFEGFYEF